MKTIIRPILIALCLVSTLTSIAQVPPMSSHLTSQAVIFLDFDGHTVIGTSWNSTGPIYCNASGLTNAQIIEVFNRVSEDYRPFNINITTDSTVFLAAPPTERTRIILTISSSWYGSSGGVSFVGSFIWGDDTPVLFFLPFLDTM